MAEILPPGIKMKRYLTVFLLLAAIAAPLSAASVDLSSTYGGAVGFMNATARTGGSATSNWIYSYRHEASLELTWMFENSMGVRVGAAYVLPQVFWEYEVSKNPGETVYPNMIKPYVSYRYRVSLGKRAALDMGAGLYGKIGTKLYNGVKYTAFEVGAEIDAAILLIQDRGALALGVKASAPFYSRIRSDASDGPTLTQFGAEVIPYAAVHISLDQGETK